LATSVPQRLDLKREVDELEHRNQSRYHSILAAVIVLGLLIILGIVIGFIVLGLENNDVKKKVRHLKNDIGALQQFPLSRVLCGASSTINLPATTNVLISANLATSDQFPSTSVGYSSNTGEISIRSPTLESGEQVIIHIQARVLISEAGGPHANESSTYSLIMSTSGSCDFGDCDSGVYSTTGRYQTSNQLFGDNIYWLELNTKISVSGSDSSFFFFFLRSNTGNGVINTVSSDAANCASLWFSLQALTPSFV